MFINASMYTGRMLENRTSHTISLDPDFHYKPEKYLHVASNSLRK